MNREQEIAWAAGLFEGEGTVGTQKQNRVRIRFAVAMTDRDVLERFHRIVGCGSMTGPSWHSGSTKPQWRWSATAANDALHLADLFRPFLGERRLVQLDRALDAFHSQPPPRHGMRDKTHCKRGHEFTAENTRHEFRGRSGGPSRRCLTCERLRGRKRVHLDTTDVLADLAIIEGRG
jgi:hypothetical protein